jgi:hypothetical protein
MKSNPDSAAAPPDPSKITRAELRKSDKEFIEEAREMLCKSDGSSLSDVDSSIEKAGVVACKSVASSSSDDSSASGDSSSSEEGGQDDKDEDFSLAATVRVFAPTKTGSLPQPSRKRE